MPRENGDVFTAFAQRRQVDANDTEPTKSDFTEQTGLYALFEVLMRGGDDAYVDLDRRLAADAIELAVGEHAQQPRLALGRHVADLIEKQGAAVGLLEAAAARGGGAREGAALVPELFRFQLVTRDRRGVEGDEGFVGAWAVAVQCTRDQLLAGAGFAVDEHGDIRARESTDRTKYLLHRRRLTDDLRGLAVGFICGRGAALVLADRAAREVDGLGDVEGRRHILERAALIGGDGALEIRMRGHDDHGQVGVTVAYRVEQREAIHARHAHVGDDGGGRRAVERLEHAGGAVEGDHVHLGLFQGLFEHPADGTVVVDDEDAITAVHGASLAVDKW